MLSCTSYEAARSGTRRTNTHMRTTLARAHHIHVYVYEHVVCAFASDRARSRMSSRRTSPAASAYAQSRRRVVHRVARAQACVRVACTRPDTICSYTYAWCVIFDSRRRTTCCGPCGPWSSRRDANERTRARCDAHCAAREHAREVSPALCVRVWCAAGLLPLLRCVRASGARASVQHENTHKHTHASNTRSRNAAAAAAGNLVGLVCVVVVVQCKVVLCEIRTSSHIFILMSTKP